MGPFESLEFVQNAYSISKSTFLKVDVGPQHIFMHWRNVASLARSICFRSLFGLRWASGEGLCSGPEVLPVMPLGTCDSWMLSRSSPWNDYRGWGQHSLHRHHRWGAREERLQQPLDAKRVPLNSFSKLSLWISWTLVEADYSKQWWFQAFFHRFSKHSLAHKSNSTAPRNHSGIPGGLQALCQVSSSLYLVMFNLECFPGTLGCSSHSTQMDTAFVYLISLVKSDFLKWPNFSKDGRCCFTTPYPDSTKNSFINSIDALHVLKWMFIRSIHSHEYIVEYTIYW